VTEFSNKPTLLVTGGAGFIGSAFVRRAVGAGADVVVLDALTYAGRRENLASVADEPNCAFVHGDIGDMAVVGNIFRQHMPGAVVHFAAESHVDRSIEDPGVFIKTNVLGTQTLLDAALDDFERLAAKAQEGFRFVHISTDEVFGSLGSEGYFDEDTAYAPRSPYSASKAASDHLVRAWGETYGLPVSIVNCTNNYGPYQFPEKFIPHMIVSALDGRPLPVYGDGSNVRDWLYVEDHCSAIEAVLERGVAGRTYCVGGSAEQSNLQVAETLADILDGLAPATSGKSYREAITFVTDRPGHDWRYAMDISRISSELGWRPERDFPEGLRQTVTWYLKNEGWWRPILAAGQGGDRRGLGRRR